MCACLCVSHADGRPRACEWRHGHFAAAFAQREEHPGHTSGGAAAGGGGPLYA